MIAVVDYGVGNLFSLKSSLESIGAEIEVTGDREKILSADKIILPGVGAFADAAKKLRDTGLDAVIKSQVAKGIPLMGICLGMQMLFEKSYEYGEHEGLGLIKGKVVPMDGVIPAELKIPHIGWNALHFTENKTELFKYINENDCVYFVHSFFATDCEANTIATTEYGAELTAAVQSGNVYGCQFHPEKSGDVGMKILRAFCEGEQAL
ncbi:MAG: imidazole glycerol phosphate synthase subunit HisH [Faecalibacterium sp.]|nr:imidazole glycerol phosphate synthase subunit HisH [Ruminococcus sp.]MCM1391277.1 imidazole glycerol phosphate synthase subunit HisH [Ruminococcus sp.]MCM1484749.1 imidazole glycerol phosphate synthase subunit HisH [Faecalibacterium sp.]